MILSSPDVDTLELTEIFGERVLFDTFEFHDDMVDKWLFLREYSNRPLCWNLEMLKVLKSRDIEKTSFTEEKMVDAVMNAYNAVLSANSTDRKNKVHLSEWKRKLNTTIRYIRMLYAPEKSYSGWRLDYGDALNSRNILGCVFEYTNLTIKSRNHKDIQRILNIVADATEKSPDGQKIMLRAVYGIVRTNYSYLNNELYDFVRNKIIELKEYKFRTLMKSICSRQQQDSVSGYWMRELKEILGFNVIFEGQSDAADKDPFDGYAGTILKTYFDHFTPEYAVSVLTEEINTSKALVGDLLKILRSDSRLLDSEKDEMFIGTQGCN